MTNIHHHTSFRFGECPACQIIPSLHFPDKWLSDEHSDAQGEFESWPPLAPALAAGNMRFRCPYDCESPSSEAFPDTPSLNSFSDIPDTLVFDDRESEKSLDRLQPSQLDEIYSVSSDPCGATVDCPLVRGVEPR